ncbi:hypothetical protein IAG25_14855 [Caballeronia sp. EK]|uniref:FimV/HubP family polar landmark protein n=1 Tax=Caballeronia sp. EK TaxID=2767469 RepID=UPI001654F372|nr:FimV/HubP family polar landmark protein [Caballeronia sp. EK]MBC8638100.1 hypothetical protein [Caballeronia sp. EK]
MIQRPRRSLLSSSRAACAAASLAVCAMFWANPGDALAQASGVAPAPTGQTYAVKPGQSLNDVVSELTGSKDRDVRAKAARALFDANPNAFGNHDINKLKLGAVLNVPADLIGSAASSAASVPEAQPNPPAETPAPAQASESAMASATAPASAVEPQASATSTQEQPTPAPASATVAPASEPALAAPAPASGSERSSHGVAAATIGLSPFVIAAVIAAVGFLLLRMRSGKKRRAAASNEGVDRTSRTFASLEEAQADADARNETIRKAREASAAASAVAAEKKSSELDRSGLAAAAASIDNADATRAPAVPSDDELPPTTEAKPRPAVAPGQANRAAQEASFAPVAPAARHPDFVPPVGATETQDQHDEHAREIAAREAARREAEKWENEEREAAARQAAVREAEEREIRAREAAAREALARESADREAGKREAELRQVTEREDQAREAAAREIIAREAELRELQARAAEEQAAEQRAAEQRDIEEQAAREAEKSGIAPDEEPVLAHRFPMPKFPQDAIQALGSLEMELPPRMELSIKPPGAAEPAAAASSVASDVPRESRPAALQPPPTGPQPIEQVPFIPQPMAQPDSARPTQSQAQSVASQIEAGTAGAASVAGLGATRFGPLSLDFDLGRASSATEPMPALTPAQLATIARNKLELAAEYIELGDLSGARTLLQEVIESNDPATRQQAATLLSTLAPHS